MKNINKLNPYYLIAMIIICSLFFYSFQWSSIYPRISLSMWIFLIAFIAGMLIIGRLMLPQFTKGILSTRKIGIKQSKLTMGILILIITMGSFADGIYSKGYPLFKPMTNYGIPTLHVIIIMLSTLLTLYSVQLFSLNKEKKILFVTLYSFIPSLLALSRAGIILSLVMAAIIYILSNFNVIKFKIFMGLIIGSLVAAFLFGLAGNYRLNNQVGLKTTNVLDSSLIYQIGSANSKISSISPYAPFFWPYLYLTSPVANLQSAVSDNVSLNNGENEISKYIVTQYTPDIVSKNLYPDYKDQVSISGYSTRVNINLNVATAFYESYLQLGWMGMIIMAVFFLLFPIVYLYLLYTINRGFSIIGIATLSTMYIMTIFDNPWAFSGISMQLILILFLALILKRKK